MYGTLGASGLSNFPWLSASILFPIGSAFVIPFFPDKGEGKQVRWFALVIALITFLITVGSYINGFNINNENVQLKESINWLPNLGLTWSVGADGLSMPLILLKLAIALHSFSSDIGTSQPQPDERTGIGSPCLCATDVKEVN